MVGSLSPVLTKRHPSAHRSLWLWSLPLGARSPGQGRVVKQRHSLHAEQDRQAPGHHVVQHDRTGGSSRTFVIFKDTKPHPSHVATWRWDSYRHEMNSTGSTSHLKEQEGKGGPPDRRKVIAVPHPPACGVGSLSPIPTPPEGSPAPFVAPEESTLGDKMMKGAKEPTKPLFWRLQSIMSNSESLTLLPSYRNADFCA